MKRMTMFAAALAVLAVGNAAGQAAAPAAAGAAAAGDAARGSQLVQACQGCHGIVGWRTAFPEVYRVPKIAGQHPDYVVKALQAYRSGERSHPSMKAIAGGLSDKDMADLAAYYAQTGLAVAVK
jgi:cytochrome c553